MKVNLIAKKFRNGKEVESVSLGAAILTKNNSISAAKYNSVKRQVRSFKMKNSEYWRIFTETGLKDSFGGYPAVYPVFFE